MAGLPGTGLGGIFYVILWLWILCRDIALMLLRAQPVTNDRWLDIAKLGGLAAAIVGALYLEGAALQASLGKLPDFIFLRDGAAATTHLAINALVPALAVSPLVMLSMIMLGVKLLGVFLPLEHEQNEGERMGSASAE